MRPLQPVQYVCDLKFFAMRLRSLYVCLQKEPCLRSNLFLKSENQDLSLNEISHFFLPLSRYIQSMYLIDHPNTTMKFKHVALKISGEGLDVSLLSLYKKYKSTNKNSQF